MTVQAKKYHIIERITHIDDEKLLDKLEVLIKDYKPVDDALFGLVKPLREKLDIEQLKVEQNYSGFDPEEVEKIIQEMDIREPLDELLEMI